MSVKRMLVDALWEELPELAEDCLGRAFVAAVLGAMWLGLAHVEAPDPLRFLMAWWGSSAATYAALTFAIHALVRRLPLPDAD